MLPRRTNGAGSSSSGGPEEDVDDYQPTAVGAPAWFAAIQELMNAVDALDADTPVDLEHDEGAPFESSIRTRAWRDGTGAELHGIVVDPARGDLESKEAPLDSYPPIIAPPPESSAGRVAAIAALLREELSSGEPEPNAPLDEMLGFIEASNALDALGSLPPPATLAPPPLATAPRPHQPFQAIAAKLSTMTRTIVRSLSPEPRAR